jgi:3-hydroxy-3-methylglutaryl CoA synthase
LIGITSFGAYIPRLRLQREAISRANSWFDSSLASLARGERSICNWDEDSVTMAVAASRDATEAAMRDNIEALFLASTTHPFLDRQNSVIVSEALNLPQTVRAMDAGGSQRAGTTAMLCAVDAVRSGCSSALVIGSEHRRTRVGSRMEMLSGDAAAAIVMGSEQVLANFVDAYYVSCDLVDHYRMDGFDFDYEWEERWIRDEGYMKLVPLAVSKLLEKAGLSISEIDHFILPSLQQQLSTAVAKQLKLGSDKVVDGLIERCGHSGVAHPLLLLAHTLERAAPGERILVIGFGQGCDALLFRATDAIAGAPKKRGVSGWLERRAPDSNYARFQTFNALVERDYGKRAEGDKLTPMSALFRNRKMVNSFLGGRCSKCGTVQFPKSVYCVNPECGAAATQADHPIADETGTVRTWTADHLTFDMNPPAYFGMVEFGAGGRAMVDFTDVVPETLDVGTPVTLQFRIKQFDKQRGFRRYFWKASPA